MSKPLPRIPEQFAKLAALAERSTFPAERETARRKAEALLTPEVGGYDRALRILAYQAVMAKAAPGNFTAGFDEREEIDNPGHMARCRAAADERLRLWHKRRAALVERFGSLEAVLDPCEREKALLKALKPWRVPGRAPHQRWTRELKGWDSLSLASKMPADMRAAVEGALPMPATFDAARAELAYWRERGDDMEHALGEEDGKFSGGEGLDRVATARMEIIRDFVEHEMPLGTLPEVLERFRIFQDRDIPEPRIEAALLRDLEALAACEAIAPARTVSPTSNRPDIAGQIEVALSADPSRSDRAIARALGCSPTTVGQVRGRMGLAGVRRSVQRGGQIYGMGGRSTPAGEAT